MSLYFSERQLGVKAPVLQKIERPFWCAFVALINSFVDRNYFTEKFPETCSESPCPVQCSHNSLSALLQAEIEEITWPLSADILPETHIILDLIEFFGRFISKPTQYEYHSYGKHNHILSFDLNSGFLEYREGVNRLLRRCKHPYEFNNNVEHLLPIGLDDLVKSSYRTGDPVLDQLLTVALSKIQDKNTAIRNEALEKLWDAWERLKTILSLDKKQGITLLLNKAFPEPQLFKYIEDEANTLTRIGNNFLIRHSETTKTAIAPEHVDYLFHRLLALIHALIRVL